jgi:hypothetical protein
LVAWWGPPPPPQRQRPGLADLARGRHQKGHEVQLSPLEGKKTRAGGVREGMLQENPIG